MIKYSKKYAKSNLAHSETQGRNSSYAQVNLSCQNENVYLHKHCLKRALVTTYI